MNSRVNNGSQIEGKDGQTESNRLDHVVALIEPVADFNVMIVQLSENVCFLYHEFWCSKEVKCKSTLFNISLVYLEWQLKLKRQTHTVS